MYMGKVELASYLMIWTSAKCVLYNYKCIHALLKNRQKWDTNAPNISISY